MLMLLRHSLAALLVCGSAVAQQGKPTGQSPLESMFGMKDMSLVDDVYSVEDWEERVNADDNAWFVEFYAPWCEKCDILYPELEKSADKAKEMEKPVKFLKVDATVVWGRKIAQQYLSKPRFPTMMLFWSTDSAPVEYTGKRESAAIDAWLDRKLRVELQTVNDQDRLKELVRDWHAHKMMTRDYYIVGFFDEDGHEEERAAYTHMTRFMDAPCAISTSAELARYFHVEKPAVVVGHKVDGKISWKGTEGHGTWDGAHMASWAMGFHMPLVTKFSDEIASDLFASPIRVTVIMILPAWIVDNKALLPQLKRFYGKKTYLKKHVEDFEDIIEQRYDYMELAHMVSLRRLHKEQYHDRDFSPFGSEDCELPGWVGEDCDVPLDQYMGGFAEAAAAHRGAAHFVVVPDDMAPLLNTFGVAQEDAPMVMLIDSSDKSGNLNRYFYDWDGAGLDGAHLSDWVRKFRMGELVYKAMSDPIPEAPERGVVSVVADNFEEVVTGEDKAVLLYVYSDKCEFCKGPFMEKWFELGELFAAEQDVVIAKINHATNRHHLLGDIQGYPNFRLYRKGAKNTYTPYNEGPKRRSLAHFHALITLKGFVEHSVPEPEKDEDADYSEPEPAQPAAADDGADEDEDEDDDLMAMFDDDADKTEL